MRRPSSRRTIPTRVGLWSLGSAIATLEMWIGPSFSMTPTGAFGRPGVGRWWRLTTFRPSTKTFWCLTSTRRTRPVLPLSLPASTTTVSSVLMRNGCGMSEHLRGEGDDLHVAAVAQLAGHRPEDPGAARVAALVDDDRGVLV